MTQHSLRDIVFARVRNTASTLSTFPDGGAEGTMSALHTADMGDVEQFYSRRLLSVALSSHPRLPTSSLDLQKDFSFSCQHMKLLALSEASPIQSALNVQSFPDVQLSFSVASWKDPAPRSSPLEHTRYRSGLSNHDAVQERRGIPQACLIQR